MSQTGNTISSEAISNEEMKIDQQESPKTVRQSLIEEKVHVNGNGAKDVGRYVRFVKITGKSYAGKRALDIAVGVFAFVAYLVLFPLIAIGIKLNSKGPVLFRQQRTGQNGHEFTCYKFRTMHLLDLRRYDGKPVVTEKNDMRIFWFGKLLRKTNLDELPQILNVLKGEMSLIGPRPYPVEECAYWNNYFIDFYYRYKVKPGVSGLAQVNGYRGGTLDGQLMRKRLDHDLIYVQKQSFWLDLKILIRTFSKLVNMNKDAH